MSEKVASDELEQSYKLHRNEQKNVLTKACRLAPPAPSNVGSDEEGSPEASKNTQKDERNKLKQVPWCVVLNVEQHQSAVAKWIDGAQDKGCHQGSEKRAPQCLEREIVAHLQVRDKQET